jgi:hypothetical protein
MLLDRYSRAGQRKQTLCITFRQIGNRARGYQVMASPRVGFGRLARQHMLDPTAQLPLSHRRGRVQLHHKGWHKVCTRFSSLGTESSLTLRWREPDSNFESCLQKTASRHASQHHVDWRFLGSGSGSDPGEGPDVRIHFAQQRVRRTTVSRGWRGRSFCSSRYDAQHRGGPSGCAA